MRRFTTFELAQVEWAAFMQHAPHFGGRKNHSTQAQKAGLRYERKAHEYIEALFPDTSVIAPWAAFRLKGEPMLRFCQPDALLIDMHAGVVTIIEVKLRHCAEAYTQVTGIYHPVIRKIFPGWRIKHLEICRWYDPAVHFPVPVQMVSSPELTPHGRFGVHIFS